MRVSLVIGVQEARRRAERRGCCLWYLAEVLGLRTINSAADRRATARHTARGSRNKQILP